MILGNSHKQTMDKRMAGEFGSGFKRAVCHLIARDNVRAVDEHDEDEDDDHHMADGDDNLAAHRPWMNSSVVIETRAERWRYFFGTDNRNRDSDDDDAIILILHRVKLHDRHWDKFETCISVSGLTGTDVTFDDFLFLASASDVSSQHEMRKVGRLIMGDASRGRIYVKGILLADAIKNISAGVDVRDLRILTDARELSHEGHQEVVRKMITLWSDAIVSSTRARDRFYELLASERASELYDDVRQSAGKISAGAADALYQRFVGLHGRDALPVLPDDAKSRAIIQDELRRLPTVCTKPLYGVLARSSQMPLLAQLREERFGKLLQAPEVDLTPLQKRAFVQLQSLVREVHGAATADVLQVRCLRPPGGDVEMMSDKADGKEAKRAAPAVQPDDCVDLRPKKSAILVHVELLDIAYIHRVYGQSCANAASDCVCPLAVVLDVMGGGGQKRDRGFIHAVIASVRRHGGNAWYEATSGADDKVGMVDEQDEDSPMMPVLEPAPLPPAPAPPKTEKAFHQDTIQQLQSMMSRIDARCARLL